MGGSATSFEMVRLRDVFDMEFSEQLVRVGSWGERRLNERMREELNRSTKARLRFDHKSGRPEPFAAQSRTEMTNRIRPTAAISYRQSSLSLFCSSFETASNPVLGFQPDDVPALPRVSGCTDRRVIHS